MIKYENAGDKISESFCILPWIHIHLWPNGTVLTCCGSDHLYPIGNLRKNTLKQIWNSDTLKNLRKEMLEGKFPNSCERCTKTEEIGLKSFRIVSNNLWSDKIDKSIESTNIDGYNKNFNVVYWDFRFSNICNFKCRTCGPKFSSCWYEEIKSENVIVNVNDNSVENIFDYVNEFINDVEEINFAGGEPLLMDEHYLILEKLIEVGNTKCRINCNTNFSKLKFKNWNVIDFWKNFNDKNIYASLDAIGPIAEYVRKGTNWKIIEENIRLVQENDINIFVNSTVSLLTIFEMPKFIDRMLELGISINRFQMNNVVTSPDIYNINIIPDDLKEKLINVLDEHSNSIVDPYIKSIIIENYDVFKKYLDMKPERDIDQILLDLKKNINITDNRRKESFVELYPYYKEWFESIK